jgi:hypothetical protein
MPPPRPDDDATVNLRARPAVGVATAPAPRRKPPVLLIGVAAGALVIAAAGGWLLFGHRASPPQPVVAQTAPPPPPPQAAAPAPAPAAPPAAPSAQAPAQVASLPPAAAPSVAPATPPPPAEELALAPADESAIAAHAADRLTVFRFAAGPNVIVLDFPALLPQGQMLNRLAALAEKAGLPRDRVLTDAELDKAIRERGDTPETFYYGHDYPAAEVVRFFALADRDHVPLNAAEEQLRRLAVQLGWFGANPTGAIISLTRAGADADVTPQMRAVILHHELSHGGFFTEPRYASYVRSFWHDKLTAKERDGVRQFLGKDGYDSSDEELMLNEMQAYVMFTHDPDFFDPAAIGMSAARRAKLEAAFHHDMPDVWLRSFPVEPPHMLVAAPSASPPPPAAAAAAATDPTTARVNGAISAAVCATGKPCQ